LIKIKRHNNLNFFFFNFFSIKNQFCILKILNLNKHNKLFFYDLLNLFQLNFIFLPKLLNLEHLVSFFFFIKFNEKLVLLLSDNVETLTEVSRQLTIRLNNFFFSNTRLLFIKIKLNILSVNFFFKLKFYSDILEFIEAISDLIYYLIFFLSKKRNYLYFFFCNIYYYYYFLVKYSIFSK
jgi:hypothetical protein